MEELLLGAIKSRPTFQVTKVKEHLSHTFAKSEVIFSTYLGRKIFRERSEMNRYGKCRVTGTGSSLALWSRVQGEK